MIGMTYATGVKFGVFWFHNEIQKHVNSQLEISNNEKLIFSIGEHLQVGHVVGVIFLKSLPLYLLKNQSFDETFKRTKFPSYIKINHSK